MIVVVTHRRGFEADPVLDLLRGRGIPYFRLNSDPDGGGVGCSFLIDDGYCKMNLSADGKTLALEDVRAAWYQQPQPALNNYDPGSLQRRDSFSNVLDAFVHALSVPWVNHPTFSHVAANKFAQLRFARMAGLQIPQTLVTNEQPKVKSFSGGGKQLVVKSFGSQWLKSDSMLNAAITQPFDPSWADDAANIEFAPVLYQTYHRRTADFRVVVVGSRQFVAVCRNQAVDQRFDVRRGKGSLHYEVGEIPNSIANRIFKLLQAARLDYCAADFIETSSGELLFVDLNVTGSWWWVDKLYDGQIASALAELLCRKAGYDA